MIAADIIAAITERGARVLLVDGAMKLRSPAHVPDDLREEARARRPEIAALLRAAAGEPDLGDSSLWKALYDDVESWSPELQQLFGRRADAFEQRGLDRESAEAASYIELREAARAPSPTCWLRTRRRIDDNDFGALCRSTIRRPAPSTHEQDVRVAAAILGSAKWRGA